MKGTYVLLIELKEDKKIKVGKLGNILFKKGFYAYVGSALNGIEKRVERHRSSNKKMHWHIDYLLEHAELKDVFYRESDKKEECKIAKELSKNLESVDGFGCSDCKCRSHLFYSSEINILNNLNNFKLIKNIYK